MDLVSIAGRGNRGSIPLDRDGRREVTDDVELNGAADVWLQSGRCADGCGGQ